MKRSNPAPSLTRRLARSLARSLTQWSALAMAPLLALSVQTARAEDVIRVSGIPDENPTELARKYQPLVDHLQKHLGGLVDTVVLDDSYHLVMIDRQRDIVVSRSIQFIANVQARSAQQARIAQKRQDVADQRSARDG